jgi:hypothetical protein
LEAKTQFTEARKIVDSLGKKFAHYLPQAYYMLPCKVELGEKFNARLDIVNVSLNSYSLTTVEGLFSSDFYVSAMQPSLKMQDGSVDVENEEIRPFEDKAITFSLHPTKAGTFDLNPQVIYLDGPEEKVLSLKRVRIIVQPKRTPELRLEQLQTTISSSEPSTPQAATPANQPQIDFEFKTEPAKKAFDYLTGSFVLDYMKRRLPLEWSGWRTLMEIAKHAGVSRHSVYGDGRSRGRAISELEHRGLVETRIFPKERGRGGKITKVRIFYERETVKRRIDQEISMPSR